MSQPARLNLFQLRVGFGSSWPRRWPSTPGFAGRGFGRVFWHDENYPIRNAILGTYKLLPDGSLKLKPVSWQATFFFYGKPNHTLYSGIARACNEVWRLTTRPKGLQFSESIIRFPAYVAGIAKTSQRSPCCSMSSKFPSAGVVAAFLSALHPWHIRYASEARAYAFVLCLIPLVLYFFLRALESGLLAMVGSIRDRRVFPDAFLSHMHLRPGRAESLRVPGDLLAMEQEFQRSHPVYALDGGKYLRGHVFSAADAPLCAAIPRLREGNTRSRWA